MSLSGEELWRMEKACADASPGNLRAWVPSILDEVRELRKELARSKLLLLKESLRATAPGATEAAEVARQMVVEEREACARVVETDMCLIEWDIENEPLIGRPPNSWWIEKARRTFAAAIRARGKG